MNITSGLRECTLLDLLEESAATQQQFAEHGKETITTILRKEGKKKGVFGSR